MQSFSADGGKVHSRRGAWRGSWRPRAPAPLAARVSALSWPTFSPAFLFFFVKSSVDFVNYSTIVLSRGDERKEIVHVCKN